MQEGQSMTPGICDCIKYACGHEAEVVGTRFPAHMQHDAQLWRRRLSRLPCLPCRVDNVRSHGYKVT